MSELAWAGGLFEGEGTIVLSPRTDASTKQGHVQLRMADKDSMERFCKALGLRPPHLLPQAKPQKDQGLRPMWCIYISGKDEIVRTLVSLYPYLGIRRKEAAQKVLTYYGWSKN